MSLAGRILGKAASGAFSSAGSSALGRLGATRGFMVGGGLIVVSTRHSAVAESAARSQPAMAVRPSAKRSAD
jgi:hypothetical protein